MLIIDWIICFLHSIFKKHLKITVFRKSSIDAYLIKMQLMDISNYREGSKYTSNGIRIELTEDICKNLTSLIRSCKSVPVFKCSKKDKWHRIDYESVIYEVHYNCHTIIEAYKLHDYSNDNKTDMNLEEIMLTLIKNQKCYRKFRNGFYALYMMKLDNYIFDVLYDRRNKTIAAYELVQCKSNFDNLQPTKHFKCRIRKRFHMRCDRDFTELLKHSLPSSKLIALCHNKAFYKVRLNFTVFVVVIDLNNQQLVTALYTHWVYKKNGI